MAFSGYLNAIPAEKTAEQDEIDTFYQLRIPNLEVLAVYKSIFKRYFEYTLDAEPTQVLLRGLLQGDIDLFGKYLKDYVLEAFSFFDFADREPERIYHAFMMGMLGHLYPTHTIRSNREVGLGRADMLIVPKDPEDRRGYVLEFKRADSPEGLEDSAREALLQIEERQYMAEMLAEGRQVQRLGIAFCGKQVKVLQG